MLVLSSVVHLFDGHMADHLLLQTSTVVSPTSLSQDLSGGSPADGGLETVTAFDQRGFPTTIVQVKGATRRYDDQGFLITATPQLAERSSPTAAYAQAADSEATGAPQTNKKVTKTSAATLERDLTQVYFAALCALAVFGGAVAL